MTKHYQVQMRGKQRDDIDADLMAQLVVMLGRQLAEDARQAVLAAREAPPTNDRPASDDAARRAADGDES